MLDSESIFFHQYYFDLQSVDQIFQTRDWQLLAEMLVGQEVLDKYKVHISYKANTISAYIALVNY